MVKIPSSSARGMGLVPGLRPKFPHAVGFNQNFFKKKKKTARWISMVLEGLFGTAFPKMQVPVKKQNPL